MVAELCHNAPISVWIMANSYRMILKFLHFDEGIVRGIYTYKHLAVISFLIGLEHVLYYYLIYQWKHYSRSVIMNEEGLIKETTEVIVQTNS